MIAYQTKGFPRRRLAAAAIALACATAAGVHAAPLQIDASGRGQVLIYPYYTVRGGLASLLMLHNGDNAVKAVKLRVRESLNGRTALSLNLYLRPYEQWSAAISEGASGPELVTVAGSCIESAPDNVGSEAGTYPFSIADFTGERRDHPLDAAAEVSGIDRTRTGLIEAIDMGTLSEGDGPTQLADEVLGTLTDSGEQQRDCAAVATAWQGPWLANPAESIQLPRGGLSGSVSVVDVAGGALFAVAATALTNFYAVEDAPGRLHSRAGDAGPSLADADHGGFVDVRVAGFEEIVSVPIAPGPRLPDAVSLALMTSSIENWVSTEPGIGGHADLLISLPTKHYYTDTSASSTGSSLFADVFNHDGASCTYLFPRAVGADGTPHPPQSTPCIGTPPPTMLPPSVCGSADAIVFARPDGEMGPLNDPPPPAPQLGPLAQQATVVVDFTIARPACNLFVPDPDPSLDVGGTEWAGLPAIGFVAQGYLNNNAQPGRIATYDSSLPHRRLPPIKRTAR